jgi:N-terminal 7TM region of histidine kinase
MHWQFTPYVLPVITSAVVAAALAYSAWQRRPAPGATSFSLLMLAVAEWSLAYALELASPDLPTILFWDNMAWLGAAFAPTLWFAFALQYTDQARWLTRRNVALLAIEPLITLLLVWTNGFHGLVESNIRLDTSGSFSALVVTYGPWYWINIAYSYLLLLLGAILICLLIQTLKRSAHLYRGQAGALLIAVAGERINDLWLEPISSSGPHPLCFYRHGHRHGFKSVSFPAVGHSASGTRSSVRKHE